MLDMNYKWNLKCQQRDALPRQQPTFLFNKIFLSRFISLPWTIHHRKIIYKKYYNRYRIMKSFYQIMRYSCKGKYVCEIYINLSLFQKLLRFQFFFYNFLHAFSSSDPSFGIISISITLPIAVVARNGRPWSKSTIPAYYRISQWQVWSPTWAYSILNRKLLISRKFINISIISSVRLDLSPRSSFYITISTPYSWIHLALIN